MRPVVCHRILVLLLGAASVFPASAQNAPIGFEGLPDGTLLTTQVTGATFTNAIVLTAGITLDEFEFPPRTGSNVASDNGGPMTITFATPVLAFGGYFVYGAQLTIQGLDGSNSVVSSATSSTTNNEALSGVSGSHPGELIQVSSGTGISKVVITGSAQGSSFTMDDVFVITRCDLNHDGFTNVSDIQAIVNQALGAAPPDNRLAGAPALTVVDTQLVINAALGYGCSAT